MIVFAIRHHSMRQGLYPSFVVSQTSTRVNDHREVQVTLILIERRCFINQKGYFTTCLGIHRQIIKLSFSSANCSINIVFIPSDIAGFISDNLSRFLIVKGSNPDLVRTNGIGILALHPNIDPTDIITRRPIVIPSLCTSWVYLHTGLVCQSDARRLLVDRDCILKVVSDETATINLSHLIRKFYHHLGVAFAIKTS